MTEYIIVRAKRRSVQIKIDHDGKVIVRAPFWVSLRQIDQFVHQNEAWIAKRLDVHQQQPHRQSHHFNDGDMFWYLGKEYPLKISGEISGKVRFENALIIPNTKPELARTMILKWYKNEADMFLRQRLDQFATLMDIKYHAVKITSATSRWGSCNHLNSISLNWKLIQVPKDVIDYVVVHELAHILQHNHSKLFWAEVEKVLPDYKIRRKWLKDHGFLLQF
ncbi:MAG: SprT family zinc-dependent metalloprotease [Patescibacteria group bacterium]|jgi:hypothetical protein